MTNLSLPSGVELISVHVPKTAGATFGQRIIPQIYPSYETDILYDYDNLLENTLIQQGKLTTKTKVIHGHFPANKYWKHYPNAKFIIWLRNPINLLISSYYFWMSNTDKFFDENHRYVFSKKLCFEDFINQSFTQNIFSNYFVKRMKLTDFYFVGIQEFFLEDLTHLKNNLGWNQFKIMTINRNRYDNYQDKVMDILKNKSLVENIVAVNSADMELYQEALSLRVQREGLSNALEMYELSLKQSRSRLKNNC